MFYYRAQPWGLSALSFWIERCCGVSPECFTLEFIIESARFVLSNNYFMFNDLMWHQLFDTAMGTIFTPTYACLTMGYLEITKFYPQLVLIFNIDVCRENEDNGITPLPIDVDIDVFKEVLNNLHPGIVFTVKQATKVNINRQNL